ncbi:MAG: DUF3298 domain-containing protein [Oscillospiraceae bacterium]|nr:DUF3298 domain-containing protein [Oscillospiraceae bacterium]
MRRFAAMIMAFILILTLCACGKKDDGAKERECGVYITVEADDVYTVSYGTEDGSENCSHADGSPISVGEVIHFDFAGEKAESTEPAEIDYSICVYDADLNILAVRSFRDDFSDHARVDITVTADHKIINANAGSSGDIVIEMENASAGDGVTYMIPRVAMPARAEAADALNSGIKELNDIFTGDQLSANKDAYAANVGDGTAEGLTAFSMDRTVRVARADSSVISFRMVDRVSLGTVSTLAITGHSYDPQTGAELKLEDLGDDTEKLINAIAEDILTSFNEDEQYKDTFFLEGYTDILRSLISDGHWYLTGEGIVIIANPGEIAELEKGFYEFLVDFDVIKGIVDERFIPAEREGDGGSVNAVFAADADSSTFTLLGSEASKDIKSIIISAEGSIYDVSVYTIKYYAESGSYTPVRQILFCSDMTDGAALAVNTELSGTDPGMVVSFTLGDGSSETRLLALDENGGLKVIDPNAKNGKIITDRLPFSADLDGDKTDETIDTSADSEGRLVVSVGSAGDTAQVTTDINTVSSIRLCDLEGSGNTGIYIDGTTLDGKQIACVLFFDSSAAEPLQAASFGSDSSAEGSIKEFADGKLILDTNMNILGTYKVKNTYTLSDGVFTREGGDISFDNEGVFVTTSKSITLANGSILKSGTSLRFTSTDGSSVINFVTDGGFTGSIAIANSGSGWTIDGQPDTSYFVSLPYVN